jgi:hypothetical protein
MDMAKLVSVAPINMNNLNFNALSVGAYSYQFVHNETHDGITYPDALDINWSYGGNYYSSVFGGVGITLNLSTQIPSVVGGTITGYLVAEWINNSWVEQTSITGISVDAKSLYQAFLTPSSSDDAAIVASAMSGNNVFVGSPFADVLIGGSGSNTFTGGGGNDTVYGGGGLNTSVYSGILSQYSVMSSGNTLTVADSVANRDGIDSLINVQQVKFTDYTVIFDLHSQEDTLVYELYQAAYARTPDNAGFRFWATIGDTNNLSAISLADSFLSAPEFTQKYGANPSNTAYVTALYTNVLGRTPDAGGLNFWIGVANSGTPKDQLLVSFATSAENAALIGSHITNGFWTT